MIDDWLLMTDYWWLMPDDWCLMIDDWLLITDYWWLIIHTLYIFSGVHQATQVFDDWWLIVDCLHTESTDGNGGPQADFVGERESSEFKRNLNGGPQADGAWIQVSINDDWWLIIDCLHTENAEGNGRWLRIIDDWLLIVFTRKTRMMRRSAGGRRWGTSFD